MQQATKDLYKLLGLSRGASQDDLRKAHRKLVREYHPDTNPGDPSAAERFKAVQHAYDVLSNPEKKQQYDEKLRASSSSKARSGRPRARTGGRTGGKAAPDVNLSDLLSRLADHSEAHKEESFQLRSEEVARLAKLLDIDITRISELLGKDITSFSRLLGENIKRNARVRFGDTQPGEFSATDEDRSGRSSYDESKKPREKRVKGPNAQRKEKRVRGPKTRRRQGS